MANEPKRMKMLFVYAHAKNYHEELEIKPEEINTENLPKKLGLITTIQFKKHLPRIKEFLDAKGFETVIGGEILGCHSENAIRISKQVDAFLYIGGGVFHPTQALRWSKPIYLTNGEQLKIDDRLYKIALSKFINGKKVGILVSMKPGQCHLDWAENIKYKLGKDYPEKEFYIFFSHTLNYKNLEDFNFIDSWVNTACPRIQDDIPALNYEDLMLLKSGKVFEW